MRSPMPWLAAALAAAGPIFLTIVTPSFELLNKNRLLLGDTLTPALPLLLIASAVGIVVWAILSFSNVRLLNAIAIAYIALGPVWISYRLLSSLIGIRSGSIFVAMLVICLVIGSMSSKHGKPNAIKVGAIFSAAMMVLSVNALATWLRNDNTAINMPSLAPAVSKPNIYHVVLDEFQSDFFAKNLDTRREAFSGFTFFPNASTPYGHTEMALGSLFSGRMLDSANESPASFIRTAFYDSKQSLVQTLAAAGYHTEGYLYQIMPSGRKSPFQETYVLSWSEASSDSSRQLQFAQLWTYSQLPRRLSGLVLPQETLDNLDVGGLLPQKTPVLSESFLQKFLLAEAAKPSRGRYVFLHILIPHSPYVLDADCSFTRDHETGPAPQHECATRLVSEIVSELKRLDRFNDSVVVFHGDHGAGFVFKGDHFGWGGSEFDPKLATGRSRPLILYKHAGVNGSAPMAVSDAPATIMDVGPSILADVNIEKPRSFVGSSVDQIPARPNRTIEMYERDTQFVTKGLIKQFNLGGEVATFAQDIPTKKEPVTDFEY